MALTAGQLQCVRTLDAPLVVAAGAGSGKTFTLTKRIVEALRDGSVVNDISQVCAITYTKKAAAELKSRIKGELRACGLIDQALKVDEAWVSTIHGMCARILRAHAIELGINPAFEVAEEARLNEYLMRAVDAVLMEAQGEKSSERLDALFSEYRARSHGVFGTSIEGMLVKLVTEASAQANGLHSFVLPRVSESPVCIVEQVIELVERQLALAANENESSRRDKWIAATEAQVETLRSALKDDIASFKDLFVLIAPIKLAKSFGGKEYRSQVDEERGVLGALVMEARLGSAQTHLEVLVELADRVLNLFTQFKHADGVLDNNDLLVLAARAIENYPSIAARYINKFKLVMVDEFQDTGQMQVDMIKRLSGANAQRLCVVGDAQQSIYRFRGADVSVYLRHLRTVRKEWGSHSVINLADNFRSHADILSLVDCVFEQPSMFGGEFMSLAAKRDETKVSAPFKTNMPRIRMFHTSAPSSGVSSDYVVSTVARRIAQEFAGLAQEGHTARDMVVLLGRMTNAHVYAQALRDEGLPCVITGGSVFSRTAEVQIVEELVRVIANPNETEALFNVLTSSIFRLSAHDLLEVGGLEEFWRVAIKVNDEQMGELNIVQQQATSECVTPQQVTPQLINALNVMGAVRRMSGEAPVSRIVEMVTIQSGWLSRLQSKGAEGLASAGNLFKAIRMIEHIEHSGATGPASVMRRFRDALEWSKEAPGALSVSGGNFVRIMTIHASKGLEFPIVAVAEFKENCAPKDCLLISSIEGKVYLSLDVNNASYSESGTFDINAVREYVLGNLAGEDELANAVQKDAGVVHRRLALREYCAEGDAEEAKRLLYVALTRAKEALVIASTGIRTKDNPAGIPKSALAGMLSAFSLRGFSYEKGCTQVNFGGSMPATVECIELVADDKNSENEQSNVKQGREIDKVSEQAQFMVPAVAKPEKTTMGSREVWQPLRHNVFSYSLLSKAAHRKDILNRLATSFTVFIDEVEQEEGLKDDYAVGKQGAQTFEKDFESECKNDLNATLNNKKSENDIENNFWDIDLSQAFKEDRATDLGSAFHRLAQYAVLTHEVTSDVSQEVDNAFGSLSQDRIEALANTFHLDSVQRNRLVRALKRWFGCNLAHEMCKLPQLSAEVPFFVAINEAYLEGEIDLLGFDTQGLHAFVIDYKTGGSENETKEELRCKHVLQAACYAYALLLQGMESVEVTFVRVEQPRADDPNQPQCICYRFTADDYSELSKAIAHAYAAGTHAAGATATGSNMAATSMTL